MAISLSSRSTWYGHVGQAPEMRFQSIDAKLSRALRKVIENAGERSMQVKYDMSMKNQIYGKSGDFIKGRELFAMILISFKSPDHTDVLYNAHHLFVFTYYGDDQLEAFYNKWLDIVYNMKHDDRPSTNSLRDMLFRKIETPSSCILTSAGIVLSMKGILRKPLTS